MPFCTRTPDRACWHAVPPTLPSLSEAGLIAAVDGAISHINRGFVLDTIGVRPLPHCHMRTHVHSHIYTHVHSHIYTHVHSHIYTDTHIVQRAYTGHDKNKHAHTCTHTAYNYSSRNLVLFGYDELVCGPVHCAREVKFYQLRRQEFNVTKGMQPITKT